MTAVFADAEPLYALAFRSDQYHARALADLERLSAERWRVVVAFSTVIECHRLILRSSEAKYASRWFDELRATAEFVNPAEDDYVAAAHRVLGYPDQPISLADGVLAVVSQRIGLPVWIYDHHFDVMRIDCWR